MNYALITARGGSKGIKNKNLKKIGNMSLIERSIKITKDSKVFDKIFCTSDSEKILSISKKNKIIAINRPKRISHDKSLSTDAIIHFYNFLKKKKLEIPKILFLFQPTSPFIKKETIKKILNLYKKNKKISSIISIYKVHNKYHYINQRRLTKKNYIKFLFEKKRNKMIRKQDKPEVFVHGNLFSFKTKAFLNQKIVTPKPLGAVSLKNFYESMDIDDYQDYELAKLFNDYFY